MKLKKFKICDETNFHFDWKNENKNTILNQFIEFFELLLFF